MTKHTKRKLVNNRYCLKSKSCCVHKLCGSDSFMECCTICEPNSGEIV